MTRETGPLSGFRDMLAEQMLPRQEMIGQIKGVYEKYGFMPLDTPAIERYETLTGKYGEEGEKLMYKFTDNGGRLLALRYDLTVPLARVVAQHQNDLVMPYKRYQVGNVWRGESPQAGRYREFMQFDADSVGSSGAIADAEVVAMMSDTMNALRVDATIRVNNRCVLDGLVQVAGIDSEIEARKFIGLLDKTEKMGQNTVISSIEDYFGQKQAILVCDYLGVTGTTFERLETLEKLLGRKESAQKGIENLRRVFTILERAGYREGVIFDQTIARGLDYYTGIIYETTLKELPSIGSVCSGGRYDNLISALGGPNLPAVGTSVGVDRLFSALQQLNRVNQVKTKTQVLIANFDEAKAGDYVNLATYLRNNGIATEVFAESGRLGKQIKFADKMGIKYMVFIGPEELANGNAKLKNLTTGDQCIVCLDNLCNQIV